MASAVVFRVDNLIESLRLEAKEPARQDAPISTEHVLWTLLNKKEWRSEDWLLLDCIAKRIDIGRKLFATYSEEWRKTTDAQIKTPWGEVASLLLYKRLLQGAEQGAAASQLYSRANAVLKSLEQVNAPWDQEIKEAVTSEMMSLKPKPSYADSAIKKDDLALGRNDDWKEIPLTLLFSEGPIARAYLETLYSLKLKPERIIQLISSRDVVSKKPVGRFMPGKLRADYASLIERKKIHYWPKAISKAHPKLCRSIMDKVVSEFDFSCQSISSANLLKPLTEYCSNVVSLMVEGLRDEKLYSYLSGYEDRTAILFTGGGIVPANLLNLKNLRFIHIHPGYLPYYRGADCVLWSSLLEGRSSATSFYMSPGIDTGDIIEPCWLPKIIFETDIHQYQLKALYRAIYCFYDPWVRSYALRRMLLLHQGFLDVHAVSQDTTRGTTFHFMHREVCNQALKRLFCA